MARRPWTCRNSVRAPACAEILEAQIEAEKAAVEIYAKGAALTFDPEIEKVLSDMGREEEGHLALMQRSLARLEP